MLTFIVSGKFLYVLAALAGVGIVAKLAASVRLNSLERQASDASGARDSYIRLWKNKFENAYRVNKGVNDPNLFVENCIGQCKLLGISLNGWERLNRLLAGLCLMLGAVAATLELREGLAATLILNHFLTALCICGVSAFIELFCETGERRQRIALNLENYFVNTLIPRLKNGVETVTAEPEPVSRVNQRRRGLRREDLREAGLQREDLRGAGLQRDEFRGEGLQRDELRGEEFRREETRGDAFRRDDFRRETLRSDELHREESMGIDAHGDEMSRDELRREDVRRDKERDELRREDARREKDRDRLKESLERIAASREPEDDERREKRGRSRREEDARLIEEILREYLK